MRHIIEKYTKDNSYLKNYLQDADVDIYQFWQHHVTDWLEDNEDAQNRFSDWVAKYHPDTDMDEILTNIEPPVDLPLDLENSFIEYIRSDVIDWYMQHDPREAPSWAYMGVGKQLIPASTWLIHFSDNANDIAAHGFKYGIDQMDKLGLTTYFNDSDKTYGGYNFAFDAHDPKSYYEAAVHGKYGADFVLFQNSGVPVFHHGDEERQIIFIGKDVDPRGIILVTNSDDGWSVQPHPMSNYESNREGIIVKDTVGEIVNWVETNAAQYRKVLLGY